MKTLFKIAILFCFVFACQPTHAQVGNLMKKAAKKLEEKTSEEAEKVIDEEIDKLFEQKEEENKDVQQSKSEEEAVETETEEYSQSKRDAAQTQAFMNMMGMGGKIETENEYDFSSSIVMEMLSFNSDGDNKEKVLYESFINPNEKTYAMRFSSEENEGSEGLMIFDYKNKAMIILSNENGEKSGMVTPIAADESMYNEDVVEESESEYDESVENYWNLKKSGNSKKILGYNCDEYVYQDEQGKVSYWFTDELKIFNSNLFGGVQQLSMFFAGQMPQGMLLQMESQDFSSNEKFQLNVKEINENRSKKINLEGYQLVSMGGMPIEGEE